MKRLFAKINYYIKYKLLFWFVVLIFLIGVSGYLVFFALSFGYFDLQKNYIKGQIIAQEKQALNSQLLYLKSEIYKNTNQNPQQIISYLKQLKLNKNYHFYIKYKNHIFNLNSTPEGSTIKQSINISPDIQLIGTVKKDYINKVLNHNLSYVKQRFYKFLIKSFLIGLVVFIVSFVIFYNILSKFDKKIKLLKKLSEEFKELANPAFKTSCSSDEVSCIINNFLDYSNSIVKIQKIKNALTQFEDIDQMYETFRKLLKQEYNLLDVNIFIVENNSIKKTYADRIYCENCKVALNDISKCKCFQSIKSGLQNKIHSECSKDYYIICLPLFDKFYNNNTTVIVQLIDKKPISSQNAIKKLFEQVRDVIGYTLTINIFKNQTYKDPLTNAYNRLFLEEYITLLFNEAQKNNINFACLFIDIDNFKSVNDTYGHKTGDQFLKEIAKIINKNLRENDVCVRYGGEEFIVILKNVPKNVAINIANRIKNSVEAFNLNGIKITVSIGISFWPDSCKNFTDCVKNADYAMYQAKKRGKNTVVEFET
ncbi:GGDEF domain-containing protein [Desulfurella sp.]|uniref:GGDEF domain-containing protein n=2 Tax=Desulfurella sp. TaxID=1962857 RepID=UPI003D1132DC